MPDAPLETLIGTTWASVDGERLISAYSAERQRVVVETRKARRSHFLNNAELNTLMAEDARALKKEEEKP